MYSASLKTRDRSSAVVAALAIQGVLLIAFLNLAGRAETSDTQVPLPLVDVSMLPFQPLAEQQASKARQKSSSAPKNRVSHATSVHSPTPRVATPPVNPIAATATPRQATDPTEGASAVRGSGTGSGGTGNGNGEGSGSGTGDGGGAVVEPPRLATPVLSGYDFPSEVIDRWPRASTVFLRLRIDNRGYVSECLLDRGTNVPAIDSEICNIAHERLRFRPALNRSGQAVAGWFGYAQPAPR